MTACRILLGTPPPVRWSEPAQISQAQPGEPEAADGWAWVQFDAGERLLIRRSRIWEENSPEPDGASCSFDQSD